MSNESSSFLYKKKICTVRQTSTLVLRGGRCVTSPEGDEMVKDRKQKKKMRCKEKDVTLKYEDRLGLLKDYLQYMSPVGSSGL